MHQWFALARTYQRAWENDLEEEWARAWMQG
jgi:hypothetical protein